MLINVESSVELREFPEEEISAEQVNGCLEKYPILKQALAAADCVRNSSREGGNSPRTSDVVHLGQLLDELDYRTHDFRSWSYVSFLSIVRLIKDPRRVFAGEIQVMKSLIPGEIQGQRLLVTEDHIRYKTVFTVGSGPDKEYQMLEVNGMSPDKDLCFPLEFVVTPMDWKSRRDRSEDPVPLRGYSCSRRIHQSQWRDKAVKPNDWDQERLREWVSDPGGPDDNF